jgi:hypothetical protein
MELVNTTPLHTIYAAGEFSLSDALEAHVKRQRGSLPLDGIARIVKIGVYRSGNSAAMRGFTPSGAVIVKTQSARLPAAES